MTLKEIVNITNTTNRIEVITEVKGIGGNVLVLSGKRGQLMRDLETLNVANWKVVTITAVGNGTVRIRVSND